MTSKKVYWESKTRWTTSEKQENKEGERWMWILNEIEIHIKEEKHTYWIKEFFSWFQKKDADSVLESSRYEATKLLHKSAKYHKWARKIDSLCKVSLALFWRQSSWINRTVFSHHINCFKVMYPVTFLIFLMIYNFVITEGEEDKCLRKSFEWAYNSNFVESFDKKTLKILREKFTDKLRCSSLNPILSCKTKFPSC